MTGSGVADADMGASPSGGSLPQGFTSRPDCRLGGTPGVRCSRGVPRHLAPPEPAPPRVAQVTNGDAARDSMSGAERYRRALVCGLDWPPTKRTCSLPLSASGVIAQVPPHAVVATLPAVSGPANGSVNPLVIPPRMQKLALTGA